MDIGRDPGRSGAVAVLGTDGVLLALHDVPVRTLSTSRGSRTGYDLAGMAALLRPSTGAGVSHLALKA
jgi:hypothetical protein